MFHLFWKRPIATVPNVCSVCQCGLLKYPLQLTLHCVLVLIWHLLFRWMCQMYNLDIVLLGKSTSTSSSTTADSIKSVDECEEQDMFVDAPTIVEWIIFLMWHYVPPHSSEGRLEQGRFNAYLLQAATLKYLFWFFQVYHTLRSIIILRILTLPFHKFNT